MFCDSDLNVAVIYHDRKHVLSLPPRRFYLALVALIRKLLIAMLYKKPFLISSYGLPLFRAFINYKYALQSFVYVLRVGLSRKSKNLYIKIKIISRLTE